MAGEFLALTSPQRSDLLAQGAQLLLQSLGVLALDAGPKLRFTVINNGCLFGALFRELVVAVCVFALDFFYGQGGCPVNALLNGHH